MVRGRRLRRHTTGSVPGGGHQSLRVALPPVPAQLPGCRGDDVRAWRRGLVRDDPAVVREVRADLRERTAPSPATPNGINGTSMRCSSRSTAKPTTCGGPLTRTVLCWTSWSSPGATPRQRRGLSPTAHGIALRARVVITDKLRSYGAAHRGGDAFGGAPILEVSEQPGRELPSTHPATRTCHEGLHLPRPRATVPVQLQRHIAALPAPPPPAHRRRLARRDEQRSCPADHRPRSHTAPAGLAAALLTDEPTPRAVDENVPVALIAAVVVANFSVHPPRQLLIFSSGLDVALYSAMRSGSVFLLEYQDGSRGKCSLVHPH